MTLLSCSHVYKPFRYPWAYEAWERQQRNHWLPQEVVLKDDIEDWNNKLTLEERNLLTQLFRFFTQADIEVGHCYIKHYANVFKPVEVLMMLVAFANVETIHIAAYSYLLDTIGMPEVEYSAFLEYEVMRNKYEYLLQFQDAKEGDKKHLAKTLAVFGAFTEGLQLYSSFAMLLNFQRFGKLKGMCQIVAWSARDESLHFESIIKLFLAFVEENPEVWTRDFMEEIVCACRKMVELESAFIDLAFSMGDIEGLSASELKKYIEWTANRRLVELGLSEIYDVRENPLPWMVTFLNGLEHVNFFENRVTEYSRADTQGTWEEAFSSN